MIGIPITAVGGYLIFDIISQKHNPRIIDNLEAEHITHKSRTSRVSPRRVSLFPRHQMYLHSHLRELPLHPLLLYSLLLHALAQDLDLPLHLLPENKILQIPIQATVRHNTDPVVVAQVLGQVVADGRR